MEIAVLENYNQLSVPHGEWIWYKQNTPDYDFYDDDEDCDDDSDFEYPHENQIIKRIIYQNGIPRKTITSDFIEHRDEHGRLHGRFWKRDTIESWYDHGKLHGLCTQQIKGDPVSGVFGNGLLLRMLPMSK